MISFRFKHGLLLGGLLLHVILHNPAYFWQFCCSNLLLYGNHRSIFPLHTPETIGEKYKYVNDLSLILPDAKAQQFQLFLDFRFRCRGCTSNFVTHETMTELH